MKELSIEEKAKAYDNVRKKIATRFGSNVAKEIFSYYEESEDERIRKTLIYHYQGDGCLCTNEYRIDYKDIRAWLEKQKGTEREIEGNSLCNGEQEPADKVEPKFKIGDWVVYECGDEVTTLQIKNIVYGTYEFTDGSTLNVVDENTLRLWTIKDVKNWDLLYSPTHRLIWIYKDKDKYHAAINLNYADVVSFDNEIVVPSDVCPANRVQRSILFQKMKEAGYEWDAQKKELKKIENNPAWSEEDEENFNWFEKFFRAESVVAEGKDIPQDRYLWFKNLKDRVQPKPKQEWSEEDEKMYARIVRSYTSYEGRILYATGLSEDNRNNILEDLNEQELWLKYRLKSLRPQNTWKPSEEQINTLWDAIVYVEGCNSNFKGSGSVLEKLYNDLKKLREE